MTLISKFLLSIRPARDHVRESEITMLVYVLPNPRLHRTLPRPVDSFTLLTYSITSKSRFPDSAGEAE